MRELSEREVKQVNGGNAFAAALLSITGAYGTGKWVGKGINEYVNTTFSMSTGQAAYYTFNNQ